MSNLPRQVKQQVEEANRMQAEAAATSSPDSESQTGEPSGNADTVPNPSIAAPVQPDAATSSTPPATPAAAEDFQHKYRTIQGILSKVSGERDRARREVTELEGKVDSLSKAVQHLQSLLQQAQSPQSSSRKLVSDSEVQEFTPELLDVVGRKAMETLGPYLQQYQQVIQQQAARIKELEDNVSGVAEATTDVRTSTFLQSLASMVPDWEAVNFDPGFAEWLLMLNPSTGASFKDAFDDACERHDATRAAWFFNAYKASRAPAPTPPPPPPPISELASPSTQGSSIPRAPEKSGRMWSEKAIREFYRDKSLGKYVANPAMAAQLEQDIFKAQQEGRVTA